MVKFNAQTVSGLLGKKFGSYAQSFKDDLPNKVYTEKDGDVTRKVSCYWGFGNKEVMSSETLGTQYSKYDTHTEMTYSSGWQKDKNMDKYRYIAFDGFVIEDKNNNGKVDKMDIVYENVYNGRESAIYVKDLLNGNY